MSKIAWNCQGLGSSLTIRHLEDLNEKYHPDIIFVMETKNGYAFCEWVEDHVGQHNALYVSLRGSCRGLAV